MRKLTGTLALAVLSLFAAPGAPAAPAASSPAGFHMPVPTVRTLPNGLRVALFVDRRVPLVQIHLLLPGGVAQEDASSPGAASAAAQLLRAGTSSRSAEEFAAEVSRLGGSITAAAGRDYSTVDGVFLSADFEAGLELLADAVVNPLFPDEEVARYHSLAGSMLLQIQQDPTAQAEESTWDLVFGTHPYGRRMWGTLESLAGLDHASVQAFHRDFYRPDGAILAIAGDLDPERAFAAAADRFGNWAGRAVRLPRPPEPAPGTLRIRIVDRPQQAQSVVRIGLVAPGRENPDALPLQVANYILGGGGFSSRLAQLLRVEGGLSYDARSGYTILRDAGLVSLATVCRNDSVEIVVRHMRDELARLGAETPQAAEVAEACRYFQGGYPLQFQSPGALITQWTTLDFYGIGPDSLDRFVGSLGAVEAAQVQAVARRWLDPAHMSVVVVGPAAALEKPLAALGPVEVAGAAGASTPALAAAPAPASAEERARGRALVAQAVAAHGGLDRLRRIKDSAMKADLTIPVRGSDVTLKLELVRQEPSRMRFATRIATAENGQILDGDHGWIYGVVYDSLRVTEADSLNLVGMRLAFRSDIVHLLLDASDSTAVAVWRGQAETGGRPADRVEIIPPAGREDERKVLLLDAESHRVVAVDFAPSTAKPGTWDARRQFRDFRPVDGILWPFHEERLVGGEHTMTILVESIDLNKGVKPALFAKPALPPSPLPRR